MSFGQLRHNTIRNKNTAGNNCNGLLPAVYFNYDTVENVIAMYQAVPDFGRYETDEG